MNFSPKCELVLGLESAGWVDSAPGLSCCFISQCGISETFLSTSKLSSVGEGQKTTETAVLSPLLNTVPTSHQLREASDLSPDTTAVPETSLEINVTAAALNATGVHSTEVEDVFISATPVVGTKTERLQASTAASPTGITVIQREHHNMSLSANSTEIPSPASTVSTLEKNPSDHEVTEPFSATEEMDDASSATPTPPPNSVPGEVLPFMTAQPGVFGC